MFIRILTLESFIDLVIHRIEKLTLHSFIAREQAKYLDQLKQDLPGDEVYMYIVYEVIKHATDFAKIFLPFDFNKVHYFSDGCAG